MNVGNILVPVDFSDASKKALGYGMTLAREFGSKLVVVHIIEYSRPLAYAFPTETFETEQHEYAEVRTKLSGLIPDEIRDGLDYRFVVKLGEPEDEVLASVSDESADLVVMGSHGRRAFRRWILGSVTEHLLRRLAVPVMTVSHVEGEPVANTLTEGRILYATDLSEDSGAGLETAWSWAGHFAADLIVFNVMLPLQLEYGRSYLPLDIGKDHDVLRRELSGQLEESVPAPIRLDAHVRLETGEGVPYEVILNRADQLQADLIVINLHGKSRQERTLLGSTAERVIRASSRPVLSVPIPDSPDSAARSAG